MTRKKVKSIVSFTIGMVGFLVLLSTDLRTAIGVFLIVIGYALDNEN